MTQTRFLDKLRAPLSGGLLVGALLIAALGIQHLRHGWPFSLHHVAPESVPLPPAANAGAVDAHAAHARAVVELEAADLEKSGIRLEAARTESIAQPVRATATVVPDEARIAHVHARIAGWVEALYATTTGQELRAGAPIAGIFSQELFASQVEYVNALKAAAQGPRSPRPNSPGRRRIRPSPTADRSRKIRTAPVYTVFASGRSLLW